MRLGKQADSKAQDWTINDLLIGTVASRCKIANYTSLCNNVKMYYDGNEEDGKMKQ